MVDLSFLDVLKPVDTDLPQLPQLAQEKLGQRKAAPKAKPQVPQLAPTENNVKVSENPDFAAPVDVVEQEKLRARQTRYEKIESMLAEDPSRRYALTTDSDCNPVHVIVTLGIQGEAIAEFELPKPTFDSFQLLALVDRLSVQQQDNRIAQRK